VPVAAPRSIKEFIGRSSTELIPYRPTFLDSIIKTAFRKTVTFKITRAAFNIKETRLLNEIQSPFCAGKRELKNKT
jgi:hypothetical protein